MERLLQDLRFGIRMLFKAPGFSAVAVLTLALGIGANAAIFSVVYHVMLRPLPLPQPDRLLRVVWQWRDGSVQDSLTPLLVRTVLEQTHSFASMAVTFPSSGCNLVGGNKPEYVRDRSVSPSFFRTLGIGPALGRDFLAGDEVGASGAVVILSHDLWRSRFNSDRGVIGKTISCNGKPLTVIGVLPEKFSFAEPAEVWMPGRLSPGAGDGSNYGVFARLRDGVSPQAAQNELATLSARLHAEHAPTWLVHNRGGVGFTTESYRRWAVGDMRRPLLLLFAAVLLVLFIACVNLAGLLFARSSVRRREVALRQAIGASRGRIVRQLLTESLVVNLAGAITGLFLARFALELIKAEGLRNMDASAASALDLAGATINGPVLWFGVLLAILSGTIAALVPSFKSADLDLNSTLKQGEMTGNTSRQHRRSRKALIAAEVAVSAMLLVGATLMVRSFILLEGVHLGFDPNNLHVAQLSFASERYASPQAIAQFEQNVLEQLHALPGVEGAAAVSSAPLASGLNLGMPSVSGTQCGNGIVEYRAISPGYFATMAAPILRGRSFAFSDSAQSTPVVIVNEVLAKMCWPSADAIGSQLSEEGDAPRQVVGIVRNMSEYGVGSEVPPIMFVPQVQVPRGINDLLYQSFGLLSAIVIRTSTPMDLGTQVERAITAVDPQQPVVSVGPMSDLISASTSVPRFLMTLMSSFAAIALALTLAGLYALMSYFVTQRTREIGIRMALGAARSDVLRMVIGEGAMLVLVGTIIGLGGAIIASRPMASLVFGIKPNDPLTFAAAAIVLIMAALWASYAPARRASRMDPMTALRAE